MTDLASRPYGFYSVSGNHAGKVGVQLADIPELWVEVGKAAEPHVSTDFAEPKKKRRYQSRGLRPGDPRHGTLNGYGNHGCRCDDCKAANSAEQRRRRAARRWRPVPDHVHGTFNGYSNYQCKCDACLEAGRAFLRARYQPSTRRAEERAKTQEMYADHKAGMTIPQVAEKWGLTPASVYSRFHTAGLSTVRHWRGDATAMYIDYCTGMSVSEVAAKWGVADSVVSGRFTRMGFARRPRAGGRVQPKTRSGVSFEESNSFRASEAGRRNAEAAEAALAAAVLPEYRRVLQVRAENPAASLAELGRMCGMSKDAYAGMLRRALTGARS